MESGPRYRTGYSTSGFAHHRLDDALAVLADLGYRAVSLTLDVQHLDPFAPDLVPRIAAVARRLRELDLAVVVETGARYLLDPRAKHQPTLLSTDGADRRAAFLALAVTIARDLGADCVSLWSGARPADITDDEAWSRLVRQLGTLVAEAGHLGLDLAFEPEPGMFIDTVGGFAELDRRLGTPPHFGLALDVGHCLVTEDIAPADAVRQFAARTVTVAIEDMRRGRHEHLPFGEGDLDLPAVLTALGDTGFSRIVSVELPRQSHDAVRTARAARDVLARHGAPFAPERPC